MAEIAREKILAARRAVDDYRTAHAELHSKPWHKGISEEHTPLLETMIGELEKQGFTSAEADPKKKTADVLAKFFDASEELNMKELGFRDRQDFEERAKDADREALMEKWQ